MIEILNDTKRDFSWELREELTSLGGCCSQLEPDDGVERRWKLNSKYYVTKVSWAKKKSKSRAGDSFPTQFCSSNRLGGQWSSATVETLFP